MDLNKNNVKKILGIITFTLILFAILINMGSVKDYFGFIWGIIFPFTLGGAIAFILNIPMSVAEKLLFPQTNEPESEKITGKESNGQAGKKKNPSFQKLKRKIARPVSVILSILFVFLIIAVVLVVVIPQLGKTIDSIGVAMSAFLPKFQNWLETIFRDNKEIVDYISNIEFDWKSWLNGIKDFTLSGAGNVLSYTMSATMVVINGVVTFIIAFIFSLYILLQKENLTRQCKKLITAIFPIKAVDKICYIFSLSNKTFSRFIAGQCVEAMILGFMFFVAMSILRIPYALMVGVLIAFTALIPMVGAFIGCIVGALLILMVNPMQALLFVILFLVLQQVEGNLIYPHVVGNSVGLPSIWVLFAVTAGGKLWGVVGMLIFIPLMSVLYTLLREWVNIRIEKKKASK